jgi:hypothetical protein
MGAGRSSITAAPETSEEALSLFMENSLFDGDLSRGQCHRYPDDVRQLWAKLEGKNRFAESWLASRHEATERRLSRHKISFLKPLLRLV